MRFRAAAALFGFALVASIAPASAAVPKRHDDKVYIDGLGGAHGYGLAMDGVEGEARNGWDHERILSLFYAGTQGGHFGGTVRVWLAEGGAQSFTLPAGGVVLDGQNGPALANVANGGTVTISDASGGVKVTTRAAKPPAKPVAAEPMTQPMASATPAPRPQLSPDPSNPAGTPIPTAVPTAPPVSKATPKPKPKPTPAAATPAPSSTTAQIAKHSAWIVPHGFPAITRVGTTGYSYRGTIEVRHATKGTVRVINHVDLETYVSGIAEEKGAGWPPEAMKVLAIAARSLAASTMTWYSNHHADGYDICPDDKCQVYHGYDGEDYAMRSATASTAGEIRTYEGSPILAMYHGNGGGQTETYGDAHPYLKSVKYPYADPFRWHVETTFTEIANKLRVKKVAAPDPVQLIKVLKRGDSPRVQELEVAGGNDQAVHMRGDDFASAIGLPSTWFYLSQKKNNRHFAKSAATINAPMQDAGSEIERGDIASTSGPSWPLAVGAFLSFVVAAAVSFAMRRPDWLAVLRGIDLRPLVLRLSRDNSSG